MKIFASTCCFCGRTMFQSASKFCFAPIAESANKKSDLWNFPPFQNRDPFCLNSGQFPLLIRAIQVIWFQVKAFFKPFDLICTFPSFPLGTQIPKDKSQKMSCIESPFQERLFPANFLASQKNTLFHQQVSHFQDICINPDSIQKISYF